MASTLLFRSRHGDPLEFTLVHGRTQGTHCKFSVNHQFPSATYVLVCYFICSIFYGFCGITAFLWGSGPFVHWLLLYFVVFWKAPTLINCLYLLWFPNKPVLGGRKAWLPPVESGAGLGLIPVISSQAFVVSVVGGPFLMLPLIAAHREIQPVHPKGNQSCIFIGRTEAITPILWPPDVKNWPIWKDPDAGKDWRQKEKGVAEDKIG